MKTFQALVFASLLVLVSASIETASRISIPFPRGGGSELHLDRKAQSLLKMGRPFLSNDGWIVQDIDASTENVWSKILDYNSYKDMVPDTIESEIYNEEPLANGQKNLFVRLAAGNKFFKLNFFVKAVHSPLTNTLTWSLDRSRESDIEESVGCWHVLPHPEDPERKSRVLYVQQISLFPWVPTFLQKAINKSAAAGSARWLKKHCESRL